MLNFWLFISLKLIELFFGSFIVVSFRCVLCIWFDGMRIVLLVLVNL